MSRHLQHNHSSSDSDREGIALFDGYCMLCFRINRLILKYHPDPPFQLIPSQSSKGEDLINRFQLHGVSQDSVVFIKADRIYTKSDALIEMGRALSGLWRALLVLRILPKRLRDSLYMVIAANRYRLFGSKASCDCELPADQQRN